MISLVVLLVILFLLFYKWSKKTYSYWENKGVKQVNPIPILGNTFQVISLWKPLGGYYQEVYDEYKNEKIVGVYEMTNPCLLIRDPEVVGNILVKDFSYFVNRDDLHLSENSEVDFGVQNLKDSEWRGVRYKLTPAFSSGKLKLMFQYMKNCADIMIQNFESVSHENVEIADMSTRYALDVIATCAFGIDVTKDTGKNSKFRNMGLKILTLDTFSYYCFLLVNFNHKLASKLGLSLTSGKTGQYFSKMIKDTIKFRQESRLKKNDFIELLLQLKNKGIIEVQSKMVDPEDSYLKMDEEPAPETFKITDVMIVSQAYTFLTAGFDGLSGPMTLLLYELSKRQSIQDRARNEILEEISKHNGLTYEALKNAKYLDCCINETLRIYPLVKFITRVCTKEYEIIPGVKVQPGTKILICNGGLQMDEKYYPNPHVFNPDRFSGEITHNVTDFTYLPFGGGPRMCIGMRFAQLTMKMGLATILMNYKIHPTSSTPRKLEMRVKTFFINKCRDTLLFNIERIKSN